jgi:neutral ceramidase
VIEVAMRILLALLLLAIPTRASDPKPGFRAGAFAQDVTPTWFPISVNGNMSDGKAKSANDPLHARCLVLDDGTTKLALVVVDSCMLPRELLDKAKELANQKTGIPTSHMLISATHTHSAPTSTGVFQSEPDEKYVAWLPGKIAEGIARAHANLAPAELGWGVADEPNQVFNRRWWIKPGVENRDPFGGTTDLVKMNPGVKNPALIQPAGPVDPAVSILAARSNGKPMALFANYSLHYVGGLPALSADYFGSFSDSVGGKLGATDPKFVGALFNGTSGDVNNVNFREAAIAFKPGERLRLVADAVGTAAKAAFEKAKFEATGTLAVAETEIELQVRKPSVAELKRAELILAKIDSRELKGLEEVYARETTLMAKYPDTVKLKLQAMRIGSLGVVGIPCEVFTEIGLELKRRSPVQPTFCVSLANGYNGYLPTPQQHRWGGYETWRARSSYLETTASDTVVKTLMNLLAKVAK